MIDDVIVGHRVAVGRDEKAGAFADDGLMGLRRPALATLPVLFAELLEKLLQRRARRERNGFVAAVLPQRGRLGGAVDLHAHGYDRGLHLGDDVGEPGRMRQRRFRRACRRRAEIVIPSGR